MGYITIEVSCFMFTAEPDLVTFYGLSINSLCYFSFASRSFAIFFIQQNKSIVKTVFRKTSFVVLLQGEKKN